MGGALLQKLDRDTQKYAIKCSYAEVNNKSMIVQKSPIEMDQKGNIIESFKKSKGGLLKLIKKGNTYETVTQETITVEFDELVTVFENGILVKEYNFYDDKPYFNVLFEDKAGFDPLDDWEKVITLLKEL